MRIRRLRRAAVLLGIAVGVLTVVVIFRGIGEHGRGHQAAPLYAQR
jgi:hypothetical protein